MAMRQISGPEFELLDGLDRVVGNTLPKAWLKASTKAMSRRMLIKGLLHKRDFRRGWIKATKFGRQHWLAFKASRH